MSTLVIIESPGKRKKLEAILGDGYTVRASYGHVRDLPERELGVSTPDYRPHYVVPKERAKDTVGLLRKETANAERVLLATDPDREGEAIAWHLAETLNLEEPERITFNEITKKSVLAALDAARPLDMDLVHAQEARRVLDRLVGYQVSPALSDRAGQTLSAGRVQSPAVRLVVERDRAIAAFQSVDHYGVVLHFADPEPWTATWKPVLAEGVSLALDRAQAELAAAVRRVRVLSFKDSEQRVPPPAPFTTSTLQQRAQAALKFKPARTMELAQRLYEAGAITYMRVDSPNLSDEAFSGISAYAHANNLAAIDKKRTWKAKEGAQEAHEAIRPTHIDVLVAGDDDDERALYKLIWERAVASQLDDATYAVRTVELVSEEDDSQLFVGRGRKLLQPGWKQLLEDDDGDGDEEEEAPNNPVPKLLANAPLSVAQSKLQSKKTKAPKRYTLATLVRELEAHGIGRPATYAAILQNILKREYILEDRKGFLSASPAAEQIVNHLVGTFDFIDLEYTRSLEQDLDEIADGKKSYRDVVSAANAQITTEIGKLGQAAAHACPECGKAMRRRNGSKGPFWGCSGYPACSVTQPDDDGKPGTRASRPSATPEAQQEALVGAAPCPRCGKPLRRRTKTKDDDPKGRGYDFWSCSGYPRCDATFKVAGDGSPIIC